jgi:hypothetical protein
MDENREVMQAEAADDWDNIDLSDLTDEGGDVPDSETDDAQQTPEAETGADQQPDEQPEADADGAEQQTAEAKTDLFTLKHLDETREVSREEVIALAQKGMDYDRIRGRLEEQKDYAELKKRNAELEDSFAFLKEFAGDRSVDEFIDEGRAQALMQRTGIDHETALGRVKLDRERKAFETERQKQQAQQQEQQKQQEQADAQEQWRKNCFIAFDKEFPDVDPKSIPQEVWDAFGRGETLVSAYSLHQLRALQKQQQEQKRAEENAKRSTGSQKSAGAADKMSAFDAAWYDGT